MVWEKEQNRVGGWSAGVGQRTIVRSEDKQGEKGKGKGAGVEPGKNLAFKAMWVSIWFNPGAAPALLRNKREDSALAGSASVRHRGETEQGRIQRGREVLWRFRFGVTPRRNC